MLYPIMYKADCPFTPKTLHTLDQYNLSASPLTGIISHVVLTAEYIIS